MARVYVSSTFSDLKADRRAVIDAVRRMGHVTVGAESLTASDQRPVRASLAALADCDVYIGIVGWRYGEIPAEENPHGLSITELEYERARELGIPRLMYLVSGDAPVPRSAIDRDTSAVEKFRARVQRHGLVAHFDRHNNLGELVMASLSHRAYGLAADVVAPVKLAVLFAGHDLRLMTQIGDGALVPLLLEGELAEIHTIPVSRTASGIDLLTRDADIVVVGMTPDLMITDFVTGGGLREIETAAGLGRTHLLPLSVRPGHGRLAGDLQWLPASGLPVTHERNRDAVLVEITDAVRAAVREIRGRRSRVVRPERPVRQVHRMVDVFKESGVPTVTFVEPEQFYQLRDALEQAGRGVVIEGPSGVGKTTALQTAIAQLDGAAAGAFRVLRARDRADLERIADLPSWHRSPVAIDDFHRLDATLRSELVDYLKLLADTEPTDRKLVIVGIPGTGRRLVEMAYDIATRITVIQLGTAGDAKVLEMVDKGEDALNVDLGHKSEIVRVAAGSLNVAQILCRHAVSLAGIRETTRTMTTVDTDMRRTTTVAFDMIAPKFDKAVGTFAALDGPDSRTCIELLGELATAEDGTLALLEVRTRRRDLRAGIDRLLDGGRLARDTGIGTHLLFDAVAATLIADDPQLTFYLRQLNPERLAWAVGKRPQRRRTRVFVSYSHLDAEWLDRLRTHLAPLERRGVVDLWADTRIAAGFQWRDEIEEALESAGVAVPLVSSDFLAPLLAAADTGGCRILPLPVRPSLLTDSEELGRYQAMIPPDRPLSAMAVPEMEAALVDVARTIADVVRVQQ